MQFVVCQLHLIGAGKKKINKGKKRINANLIKPVTVKKGTKKNQQSKINNKHNVSWQK